MIQLATLPQGTLPLPPPLHCHPSGLSHLTSHCAFSICLYLFHFHTHPAPFLNTYPYPTPSLIMCQSVFPFELRPLHLTLQSGLSSQVTLFSFARFVCFRFRFRFTFRFVLFCLSFFEKPLLLPLFKFNCGVPQPPCPPPATSLCCVVNPFASAFSPCQHLPPPRANNSAPSVAASTNYGLKFKHKFVSKGQIARHEVRPGGPTGRQSRFVGVTQRERVRENCVLILTD